MEANLAEKAVCAAAMGYLYIEDSRVILWKRKKTGPVLCLALWLLAAAAGIGACIGLNELFLVSGLTEMFSHDMELVTDALYGKNLYLEIAVMAAAAPLGEELLFRGVLFRRMRTWCGFLPAAVITSLIFALFHGNILQGAYGFFMGMIFAFGYERLRTIWVPVWMHAAANGMSVLATEYAGFRNILAAGPVFGMAAGLFTAAAALILLGRLTAGQDTEGEQNEIINNSRSEL